MRALFALLAGVVAVVIAIVMAIMGAQHVFGTGGGALYYGIVFVLGVGGAFVVPVAWSYLSSRE